MGTQSTGAMAFEATAALDRYEEQLAALRRQGAAAETVVRAQAELHRICDVCLHLPRLSSAALDLLLSHHRLLAELARGQGAPARASQDSVDRCIALLRRECRGLFVAAHLH